MMEIQKKLKQTKFYSLLRRIYHRYQKFIQEKKRKQNQLQKGKLEKELQKYDIISFDIFDTLVTRKIYDPDDVFDLLGEKIQQKEFKKLRKEAENRAREELCKDVNLDEIYAYYQKINDVSESDAKKIQTYEEDLECRLTTPRKDMLSLVEKLYSQNKRMIIVSDMYLKKDMIEKMLEICGYRLDFFEDIYISNAINKRKDTKAVWPYIKEKYPYQKIIHLGDNYQSDVLYPKEFGIQTWKIKSSKELFQESVLYPGMVSYVENKNPSDSIFFGMMVQHTLFNSPFCSLKIESIQDFGYVFHGVMIYEYFKFLVQEAKNCDILLFLAREGYHLQRLYQIFCEYKKISEKPNVYFLTSRKAVSTATIRTKKELELLLKKEFHGTFQSLMKQLFCMDVDDEEVIILPDDLELVKEKIKPYQDQILKNAKSEREAYFEYIKKTVPNFKNKMLGVVDLGYSGTIQYHLTKLLNQEMQGIYLTNSDTVKKYSENSKLSFCFDITENDNYRFVYYYSLVLEFFLSAPFGQLQKFEKKGTDVIPIYNDEIFDDDKKRSVNYIFESVREYFRDMSLIEEIVPLEISPALLVDWYKNMIDSNIIDRTVKDQFDFMDSYEASTIRNVFQIISKY